MIKVASCWDLGWNTPLLEFDLWSMGANEFEVDELIMTPISGIQADVTEYIDIPTAMDANKDLTHVFVDEEGEVDIEDFIHPEKALYVFGRVSFSPMRSYQMQKNSVRISTISSKHYMWGHQAMCLVLYDRMKKNGCNNNR